MNLLGVFGQTLETTLPVFAMVFMGVGLRRIGWIDTAFINTGSALVFKGTLPTLVFLSIIRADLSATLNPSLIIFFLVATIASFLLCWLWAIIRISEPANRGVYVQGSFRGNGGIVGLALAANLYGDYGLSAGSILLGAMIISYNVLSVIVLSAYQSGDRLSWWAITKNIARNPLIIAVIVAVPVAWKGVSLPDWIMTSGDYFAALTLPLALLCIGGTLSMKSIRSDGKIAASASLMKMVIIPVLCTAAAWALGFSGAELGLLFLFFASPTAAVSFVMVKALNGNHKLAANIIAITTLLASVTITVGVFVLRASALI